MNISPKSKLIGIDSIRAFACLWVFASHAAKYIPEYDHATASFARTMTENFILSGSLGVCIFFVLSGYLLSMPFWRSFHAAKAMPNLKVYFLRRFFRIAPEFYICVILTALIGHAFIGKWAQATILALITFTAPFSPGMYLTKFNAPLWSIGIEMQFYFLLPLVMLAIFYCSTITRARISIVLMMAGMACLQLLLLAKATAIESLIDNPVLFSATSSSTTKNTMVLFLHFMFGMIAADIHLSYSKTLCKQWRYDLIALLCIAVLIVPSAINLKLPGLNQIPYQWPLFPAVVGCLLIVIPRTKLLSRLVEGHFWRMTATLSFGIYLYHLVILQEVMKTSWADWIQSGLTTYLVSMAGILAVSYIAGAISYYLVGLPGKLLGKKIEDRWVKTHKTTHNGLATSSFTNKTSRKAA